MTIDSVSLANIPCWNTLPMGITNFGGDTQVFTIPEYASSQIGCTLNDRGLAAIQGGAPTLYNNWGFTPSQQNPFLIGMEQTMEQFSKNMGTQTINTCLSAISAAKNRLNAMLLQGNYSKKQQKQIEKLLERLAEQEEKLAKLAEQQDLTPSELVKKANAIEKDVRAILTEISKIGKPGSTSGSSGTSGSDDDTDVNETEPAEDEDDDGIGDYPTYSDDALILADDFKKAINYTWGTDDELFNQVCDKIDQHNVIDVMLAWQDNHSLADNESFMTAFFRTMLSSSPAGDP